LDSRYRWSSDGGSIIFTTTRSDPLKGTAATIIYEYDLRTDFLLSKDNLKEISDWEEAEHLVTEFRTSETSELISVWQYPDGNGNLLDVDAECSEFNISKSPLGNFAIAAACPDNKLRLYWANSDGTLIKQLFDLSLYTKDFRISQIVWSLDDKYIAFNVAGDENLTNMYVVNVEAILKNEPLATLHEILSDGTEIYATNNPVQVTLGGGSALNYGAPSWQPTP
jgi:Tol biopolymer transport system component